MQSVKVQTNEETFLEELYIELEKIRNFSMQRSVLEGEDLVVRNLDNGSEVIIELKSAGRYGELPISTIIPLAGRVRSDLCAKKIILVSFSNLPNLLLSKLNELGVQSVTNPTVDKVVKKVQTALG